MACSDDRTLGRVPAYGSDCGTLCRTASFRVGGFFWRRLRFWRGLRRRWWRLCGWCLRWRLGHCGHHHGECHYDRWISHI